MRTEVGFQKYTSLLDVKIHPNLYKVNQTSKVKLKINLGILITNEYINLSDIPDMHTDDDVLKALIPDGDTSSTDSHDMSVHISVPDAIEVPTIGNISGDIVINEMCVVIWDRKDGKRQWYLHRYLCLEKCEDGENDYEFKHLEWCLKPGEDVRFRWRYPKKLEIKKVSAQLIPCNVIRTWMRTWKKYLIYSRKLPCNK